MASNLLAGLLAGIVTFTYSLSYAAFLFSGKLSGHLHVGLLSALLSACIIAVVVALGSSFRFAIAGPDSNATALLALMAASIVQVVPANSPGLLPTLWMAIAVSSVATGVALAVLGRMRLGRLIRFIPYPVVGGFLAATGWLLFQGSFQVMSGIPLSLETLDSFSVGNAMGHCLAGLGVALFLLWITRRWKHFLVLPCALVVVVGLFYGTLQSMDISLATARAEGWLFPPMGKMTLHPWASFSWSQTHWWVLLDQVTNLMAMMAVVAMTILLNASGLELSTSSDAELDRELQVAGGANLVAGLFGGMVGYLSISRSLLNHQAGARGRTSGIVAAAFCAGMLWYGATALLYIPKPLLGGLLCYLGLSLLFEWVIDARKKLSRFDYILVLTILLFVSVWDFLTAVGLGTVIACLLFAFNYSRVRVVKHALSRKEHRSNVVRGLAEQELLLEEGERIGIFFLQGYLFFGTVSTLISDVRERVNDESRAGLDYLILDFRLVSGLDSSATLSFLKLKRMAEAQHIMLLFTHLDHSMKEKMEQSGCLNPADKSCRAFTDLDRGLEFCENLLLLSLRGGQHHGSGHTTQLSHLFPEPSFLPQLLTYTEKMTLPKGMFLFRQGDTADAMYLIEGGKLTVSLQLPEGRWKRLATIGAGTLVGEIGMFLHRERTASVVSEEPVTLYQLSRKQFTLMQHEHPALAMMLQEAVIGMLAKRLLQANKELDILLK